MKSEQVLKGVLLVVGVLILFLLFTSAISPGKTKARAQRIGSVNAAPRVVTSMLLSNTAVSATNSPGAAR